MWAECLNPNLQCGTLSCKWTSIRFKHSPKELARLSGTGFFCSFNRRWRVSDHHELLMFPKAQWQQCRKCRLHPSSVKLSCVWEFLWSRQGSEAKDHRAVVGGVNCYRKITSCFFTKIICAATARQRLMADMAAGCSRQACVVFLRLSDGESSLLSVSEARLRS